MVNKNYGHKNKTVKFRKICYSIQKLQMLSLSSITH